VVCTFGGHFVHSTLPPLISEPDKLLGLTAQRSISPVHLLSLATNETASAWRADRPMVREHDRQRNQAARYDDCDIPPHPRNMRPTRLFFQPETTPQSN